MITFAEFIGERPFNWAGNPRTRDSLKSQRVRFTEKEYIRFIKPRLWFNR